MLGDKTGVVAALTEGSRVKNTESNLESNLEGNAEWPIGET